MNLHFKRIISYAIDYLLVVGLGTIYMFCASIFYMNPSTYSKAVFMLICALITTLLLTCYVPTKTDGQTIGQKLMHLRVVNKNGHPRSYWQSFLRECVIKISCAPIFVLFSLIYAGILLLKRNGKAEWAHDALLKTSVVSV